MKGLEQFALSQPLSIAGAAVFFGLLWGISRLPKKKFEFAVRVLIGAGAGTVLGLAVWAASGCPEGGSLQAPGSRAAYFALELGSWFRLAGAGYIKLLELLVLPAVFLGGVRLVLRTPSEKQESRLTRWKKRVNTLMLAVSAGIGTAFGYWFSVGRLPWQEQAAGVFEGSPFPEAVLGLVPGSLGIELFAGNAVGIFVFAVFVGIAARRMSGKYLDTVKPFLDWIEAAFSVYTSVCKAVIAYKPAGAAAIMAWAAAYCGPGILLALVKFLAVLCAAAAAVLLAQLLLCALSGVGPGAFLRAGWGVMGKALKTRSGSACLPDAQQALGEKLGLDRSVTDPVSAYAIASGMQGCGALFPALAAVFAANLTGHPFGAVGMAVLVIGIVLISYGITGIPGTATMAEFGAVTTNRSGAVDGLGLMVAIDPIGDVPRTLINVTGCMANAIIVERRVRE